MKKKQHVKKREALPAYTRMFLISISKEYQRIKILLQRCRTKPQHNQLIKDRQTKWFVCLLRCSECNQIN